jgi:hypothetical protein
MVNTITNKVHQWLEKRLNHALVNADIFALKFGINLFSAALGNVTNKSGKPIEHGGNRHHTQRQHIFLKPAKGTLKTRIGLHQPVNPLINFLQKQSNGRQLISLQGDALTSSG